MVTMRVALVLTVLSAAACKDEVEKRIDRWQSYTQEIANKHVLEPVFDTFDTALAKGDRKALQDVLTSTVYDLGITGVDQLGTASFSDVVDSQLAALTTCGVVGKTDHVFQVTKIFGAVGLKNALFDQLYEARGETPPHDALRVLPQDGIWIMAAATPNMRSVLARCGVDADPFSIVIAPMKTGEWRVIAFDFLRPHAPEPDSPSPPP